MRTLRGCTAGNPVADFVYIASDLVLARRLSQTLAADGLATTLPDHGASDFFGVHPSVREVQLSRVAYVDDGVVPIVAPAYEIDRKLSVVASVVRSTYQHHGLDLNFSPGKSEAVVSFHGPGAKSARNRLY